MHAYLYLRIRGAFSLNKVQWTASAVWALLMIFAPFFIRYAEKAGLEHKIFQSQNQGSVDWG